MGPNPLSTSHREAATVRNHRVSGGLTRWLGLALALIVGVVAITIAMNSGSPQAPQAGPAPSDSAPSDPSVDPDDAPVDNLAPQESPLVTRMLTDLRAGRKPESQDTPLAGAPVKVVRAGPENPAPIGELAIPAIDLRTPMFEGVYEDALLDGPGHWPGTPGPGERGNMVISGHRSTETRPFLYLDRLSAGDTITLTRGDENFRYAVDNVTIVPQAGYVPYVLEQPPNPRTRMVTLFACNPLTAHYERIVVRARALGGGRSA